MANFNKINIFKKVCEPIIKFNSKAILNKILLLVGILIIFISIVGYVGFYFNEKSGIALSDLQENKIKQLNYLNTLTTIARENKANFYEAAFKAKKNYKKDVENLHNKIDKNQMIFVKAYNDYLLTNINDFERQKLQKIYHLIHKKIEPERTKILYYLINGKNNEAKALLSDLETNYNDYFKTLNELNDYINLKSSEINKQNKNENKKAKDIITLSVALATFISMIMAINIANNIARRINLIMNHLEEISKDNLNLNELPVIENDELSYLSNVLNITVKRLRELKEYKNKMIGITAHDLRSPITTIKGYSEILLAYGCNPTYCEHQKDQKEIYDYINQISQNMLNLINDLLDISAMESGKLLLKPEMKSLTDIVNQKIKVSQGIIKAKNINIVCNIEDIPPLLIDANRISQAMDNLLSNALKFSPTNSVITINLFKKDNSAILEIKDEGPGISEEDQKKLFKEFEKLSAKPTANELSTGLGLAITKKLIDAHNGLIEVESVVGVGSTFRVKLFYGEIK